MVCSLTMHGVILVISSNISGIWKCSWRIGLLGLPFSASPLIGHIDQTVDTWVPSHFRHHSWRLSFCCWCCLLRFNHTISWWHLNCAVSNATCASRRAYSAIVARNDPDHKDALLLHDYASNIYIIICLAAPKHAYLYRIYVPWTFHLVLMRNLRLLIVGYTLLHGCYASRSNRSMIVTLAFLMWL